MCGNDKGCGCGCSGAPKREKHGCGCGCGSGHQEKHGKHGGHHDERVVYFPKRHHGGCFWDSNTTCKTNISCILNSNRDFSTKEKYINFYHLDQDSDSSSDHE